MATAAFTFEPPIRAPSPLLGLAEVPRALFEFGSLAWAGDALAGAPRGDGHPVLVLPGFVAGDTSTGVLRRYLGRLDYDVHTWNLGRNLGPRSIGREGEKLLARVEAIHAETGAKVSLVGWSLGGIMARLVARRLPAAVRQVVTLGSPFAGCPKTTRVWRAYELLTGQRIDDAHTQAQLSETSLPTRVPTTAIYSRGDGVVAWQNCRERSSATTDSIEVNGSHLGLVVNPAVLYAVADRLALPADGWRPFDRRRPTRLPILPKADRQPCAESRVRVVRLERLPKPRKRAGPSWRAGPGVQQHGMLGFRAICRNKSGMTFRDRPTRCSSARRRAATAPISSAPRP